MSPIATRPPMRARCPSNLYLSRHAEPPAVTIRREDVLAVVRRRVLAGMRHGGIRRGDRLPSVRMVADELGADARHVLAAYRELAREGLVELRPRSGIYAAVGPIAGDGPPPVSWAVDVFLDAIGRELPAPAAVEWLRRSLETLRLRVLVVARTADQRAGISRELRVNYGLETDELDLDDFVAGHEATADAERLLRRADLVVTTEGGADLVEPVAHAAGRPVVLASVRPDLVGDEWRSLLQGPVFVVVTDRRFGELVGEYLAGVPGSHNVRTIVAGEDSLEPITEDAAVYATTSARARLGDVRLPGRLLPPARIFSAESSRELLGWMVRANLAAHAASGSPMLTHEPD